ncbi:hypothetical protein BSFP_060270 [Burkholderia stabilis]|uniref:Uncharacterized protein n=1 Tax=Burkholderia stabilis TaxID=95485 RepID=A0A1Y1BY60_9BURK|nr:hypothetical protein BSFP_060270 [Burkholderia stabilis]
MQMPSALAARVSSRACVIRTGPAHRIAQAAQQENPHDQKSSSQ